jgi:hypothetical protein
MYLICPMISTTRICPIFPSSSVLRYVKPVCLSCDISQSIAISRTMIETFD